MAKTEKAIFTNMCMISDEEGNILVEERAKNDWRGIAFPGGHVEPGEAFGDSVVREVREETGIPLTDYRFAGKIRFEAPPWPSEIMYLYRATVKERSPLPDCDEGVLAWVDKSEALSLPMWEGDRVFFSLMEERTEPFSLLLRYEGDTLVESRLGGNELFFDEE